MHRWTWTILGLAGLLLCSGTTIAQEVGSAGNEDPRAGICRFVDEDGDGFNDLAPDDDGDGIPNGLDPDFVKHRGGSKDQDQHLHSWQGALFSKMFGFATMSQHEGFDHQHGPDSGPGVHTGFGPDEHGAQGSSGSSDHGHREGRRGGHQ